MFTYLLHPSFLQGIKPWLSPTPCSGDRTSFIVSPFHLWMSEWHQVACSLWSLTSSEGIARTSVKDQGTISLMSSPTHLPPPNISQSEAEWKVNSQYITFELSSKKKLRNNRDRCIIPSLSLPPLFLLFPSFLCYLQSHNQSPGCVHCDRACHMQSSTQDKLCMHSICRAAAAPFTSTQTE